MANNIPTVEFGFALCKTPDGRLSRGAIGVGTTTGVQFPETCPTGMSFAGTVHSHPNSGGGSILPSAQDIREASRLKMPALCIINNTETQCYKPRSKR